MPVSGLKFGTPAKRAEASKVILPALEYRRRKMFMLVVGPDIFEWDRDAKAYLPTLMKIPLIPGCGGVKKNRDASVAVAYRHSKGQTAFKDGDHRLKMEGDPCPLLAEGQYRAEHWARMGKQPKAGKAYSWAWEGYELAGKRVIWGEDAAKRRRFQIHIAENVLPEMSLAMRRWKFRVAEGQLRRAEAREDKSKAAALRVRVLAAVLADLLADLEKHAGPGGMNATLLGGSAGKPKQTDENGDPVVDIKEDAA